MFGRGPVLVRAPPSSAYDPGVESKQASPSSPLGRLAATVYDAHGGGRSSLLSGPWWLSITVGLALGVLVFGGSPWQWSALPVMAAVIWLPFCVRWVVALGRSVSAFRQGYRS